MIFSVIKIGMDTRRQISDIYFSDGMGKTPLNCDQEDDIEAAFPSVGPSTI